MKGRPECPLVSEVHLPAGALEAVIYLRGNASPPTPDEQKVLGLALSELFGPSLGDPEGAADQATAQATDQRWRFADRWWQVTSQPVTSQPVTSQQVASRPVTSQQAASPPAAT